MKDDRLRVWIDGACEPINPGGAASYGLVIKHGQEILFEGGAVVGSGPAMSNNVAEYSGLIAFLEWYLQARSSLTDWDESNGADYGLVVKHDGKIVLLKKRPAIYSDSKLLINQMTGEWRVKGGLYIPYYYKAQAIIEENGLDLGFWWVPRSENEEADRWSKKALPDAEKQLAQVEQRQ